MDRREFKGAAAPLQLAADISSTATTFTVSGTTTGWPTGSPGPFVVRIGATDAANAEKVLCSSRTGSTFTVAPGGRGYDGTTASSHTAGEEVAHVWDATSAQQVHDHAADTTRDDHSQYIRADGTRGFTGLTAIAGNPGQSRPGDSFSPGVTNALARADHVHGREPWGTTTSPLAMDSVGQAGTADQVARADHTHSMPGWAGTGGLYGVDSRPARADHTHTQDSVVHKTTDESVVSSTTLQDDDHLGMTLEAGTWLLEGVLFVGNTSTGMGFKAALKAPAGASGQVAFSPMLNVYLSLPLQVPLNTAAVESSSGYSPAPVIWFSAYVVLTATGEVRLQWAQQSANATALVVKAGSWMRAQKVA